MSVVSLISAKTSKTAGEKFCTKSAISFAAFDKFVKVIRAAWPKKTPEHVAYITGTSERTVQFWLAGTTRMNMDATIALLRTEAGFEILDAVMGDDCKAEWWLVTKSAQEIRKSKKAVKVQQERIAAIRAQLDLLDNQ